MAQSGHSATAVDCPLSGVNRTFQYHAAMSASDPKRTLRNYSLEGECVVLMRLGRVVTGQASGRACTITGMPRGPVWAEAVNQYIATGHRQDQKRAHQDGWGRRRNAKDPTPKAKCESERKTQCDPHSPRQCIMMFPSVRRASPAMKPRVIDIRRHAPMSEGGAGDGMSNHRHPAPMPKPSARPTMAKNIALLLRRPGRRRRRRSRTPCHLTPGHRTSAAQAFACAWE